MNTILLPIRCIASYFVEFLESVDEIFGKIWNCLTTIGGTPWVFPMRQSRKGAVFQIFKNKSIQIQKWNRERRTFGTFSYKSTEWGYKKKWRSAVIWRFWNKFRMTSNILHSFHLHTYEHIHLCSIFEWEFLEKWRHKSSHNHRLCFRLNNSTRHQIK